MVCVKSLTAQQTGFDPKIQAPTTSNSNEKGKDVINKTDTNLHVQPSGQPSKHTYSWFFNTIWSDHRLMQLHYCNGAKEVLWLIETISNILILVNSKNTFHKIYGQTWLKSYLLKFSIAIINPYIQSVEVNFNLLQLNLDDWLSENIMLHT